MKKQVVDQEVEDDQEAFGIGEEEDEKTGS